MYQDIEKTTVLTKYQNCQNNTLKCNCGFYLMLNNSRYVYLDFCGQTPLLQSSLSLKYFESKSKLKTDLDCSYLIKDGDNELEWKNVKSNINDFKCARLTRSCGSYLLRTTNKTNNIQVKLNVNCENIKNDQKLLSQVEITPLFNNTAYKVDGLCGILNGNDCTNYVNQKCETDSDKLFSHWK